MKLQPNISFANHTPRLNLAYERADMCHEGQFRKISGEPYIVHPIGVMEILAEVTDKEDTLIGALLHDTREMSPDRYSWGWMQDDFGDWVPRIVSGVTKDATIEGFRPQAEKYLANLTVGPVECIEVADADKIYNLNAILGEYAVLGDALWSHFNGGKIHQQWWYNSVLAVSQSRLPDYPLTRQLDELVTEFNRL